MAFRLSSGDVTGFKVLFSMAIMYGLMAVLVYSIVHMHFITPLGIDAPLDRFSEGRALQHLRVLSQEIGSRQEGSPGLKEAARYIKAQLEVLKERAGSNIRIEIEETIVDGSFNMIFLGYSISLGYRNHTNVIMRISSVNSQETDPSVLLNGHFDSPLGSPGAGDCGSCVASMLEMARLTVDSGWVPPRPIIFLFNGAEELFLLGAHGFMKTHKWSDTIGAFINIEASGTGGLDLVCQSGPGSWPSLVYAQSAVYPMAHSAAQDVFPVIPGDTDYRIFAEDYGDIPGLDIIFLLGGYFYHTSYDTMERLLPGSIQARGENLLSITRAFANSSKLLNAHERESLKVAANEPKDERAVFFDYLSWFMIFYSRRAAVVLHTIPIAIFLLMPFLLFVLNIGKRTWFSTFYDFFKGLLLHTIGVVLAVVVPIVFAILRLLFSNHAMSWFARPYLAFMMFIPCSLVGVLIPRVVWRSVPLTHGVSRLQASKEWGEFEIQLLLVTHFKMIYAPHFASCIAPIVHLQRYLSYTVDSQNQRWSANIGSLGKRYFIPDIIVAAVIGLVTSWCVGPLIPICGHWLARSSILKFLLQLSVLALALSSQFFPYSIAAPKRVVFQHTFLTADASRVVGSSYDFSVVDSNSLPFLFEHAPEVAKELNMGSELSFKATKDSPRQTWMVLFPVSFLFSGSLKFPARSDDMLKHYSSFPHLSAYKPHTLYDGGSRRVHLEFYLGSLEEVWVSVLNITGPLSSWSFADNVLPAPESRGGGGPLSYICRLSGASHENWTFWLEASSSEEIRVEVAVLDQYMVDAAKKLKGLFPSWVDVTAYSSFLSSYVF
uniref:Uncharacterized protein n=1 Tax=Vitis vinifera TaxID=29760 RepID=A5B411_VITVI|nr:hypothetical protein VITISV_011748 [Vitis vinifera]